ncbi:MAG TPA: ABC transporter ATP-binding protein [Myxococcota bacterium]|nr:ABC transporter ATP-binding protein [Myxococcota bacterium]
MSADPRAPAVVAEDVCVTYGAGDSGVRALRALSLVVPRAQFVVVRGRSGSGKTTLLHVVAGLRRPDTGRVAVGGTELSRLSEGESARFRRRHIGLVYQFFNLVPTLSVEHNVALPLLLDGWTIPRVRGRVEALLARLGLPGHGARAAGELSGGQMQRVAIARALVAEPVLVLADEPTGSLDSETGRSVLALFRELCDERGTAFVMMTHDLDAAAFADRVVELRDGALERDGAGARAATAAS